MNVKTQILILFALFTIIPIIIIGMIYTAEFDQKDTAMQADMSDVMHSEADAGETDLQVVSDFKNESDLSIRITAVLLFNLLLLEVAVYFILTKAITKPKERLLQTIYEIGSGDMSARSGICRRDELGEISVAFDDMMDTLYKKSKQLQTSEERYRIIAEQSDGFIFEYNLEDDECYYSPNWKERLGFQPAGCNFLRYFLSSEAIHPDEISEAESLIRAMMNGQETGRCEVRMKTADGRYLWCSLRVTAVFDEKQTPVKVIGKITDIDLRKRETEQLKCNAQRDLLSELYNKVTVEHLIDDYLSGEGADGEHALFIIDIDNFKSINDSLGHLVGDQVIKDLSGIVANVFRESDISGRIGGDELIVLMKKFGTKQALASKVQILVEAMCHTIKDDNGEEHRVSCSVGISIFPRDGKSYIDLFTKSDAALYTAKANGKNQCYILGD